MLPVKVLPDLVPWEVKLAVETVVEVEDDSSSDDVLPEEVRAASSLKV